MVIYRVLGIGIILTALFDMYLTVLYPRTGKSVISLQLSKGTWRLFRWISHLPGIRKDVVLSYCGPTLLIAIASFWVCAVAFGFALLMWPALGSGIQASSGKTPTDFATAFYYSGFTLTTLGVGDLVPETGFWRFVTVLEAAVGFSIITASLTYLLSVYNALTRRNTFALSLYHRAGNEANAAILLSRLKGYRDFEPAIQEVSDITRELIFLLESHHAYPVLHYFRFSEPRYALARMAMVSLDLSALINSAIHPKVHEAFIDSTSVIGLNNGGLNMLFQLSNSFLEKREGEKGKDVIDQKQLWRRWYFLAIQILQANGIETIEDIEAGADKYVLHRSKWNDTAIAMAEYMEYRWNEIAPGEQKLS